MKNYLKFTGVVVATVVLSNVAFGYGIAAQGVFEHGHPVHELITRKAAVDAKFITHLDSYQMNNLIEGVRYNDDPETLLNQGNVLGFAAKFLGDNKGKKDPTEAVHFGDEILTVDLFRVVVHTLQPFDNHGFNSSVIGAVRNNVMIAVEFFDSGL